MAARHLIDICNRILDLEERSYNVTILNAYLDALGLNFGSVIGSQEKDISAFYNILGEVLEKMKGVRNWK